MDTLVQIGQILFILSVLVVLHEFGHYIPAKLFKVRVEKFYLFMDPYFSLFKKKIKDTEWGIGWLPIGGYVKLSGMIDESMDAEQMAQPAQPWEFRSKKPWQRLIIMLGGITVNIILAWFIYTVMFATVGQKYISTEMCNKTGFAFGEVGEKAGFKSGDKILSVDGKFQEQFQRLFIDIILGDDVVVQRDGAKVNLKLTDEMKKEIFKKEGRNFISVRVKNIVVDTVLPKSQAAMAKLVKGDQIVGVNNKNTQYLDQFTKELRSLKNDSVKINIVRAGKPETLNALVTNEGTLGFEAKGHTIKDLKKYEIVNHMSFTSAIPLAVEESYTQFIYNIKQFKLILRPKTEAYKQVKSPIGITRSLPTEWDWEFVFKFMAVFSIGLAFMNLLPIPGLDGGHALFTIAEMITGKTLSIKVAERVQTFGMIILLSLMALTFGKDIYEIIIDNFFKK
ncbi:RIP metalloprotease RseP [Flavobacterium sp.]|uniref:RIP metalloprotease RseP n=1 Tax=Flavobacterium sp. TaxID=239 RepID=UPI00286E12EB|nr:RIP metalloprotease RseP [Flavobacterium sp.]